MEIIDVSESDYDSFVRDFKGDIHKFEQDVTSINNTFDKSIEILFQLIKNKEKEILQIMKDDKCYAKDFSTDEAQNQVRYMSKLKIENSRRAIVSYSKDCTILYKQKEFNTLLAQKIFIQSIIKNCFELNHQHYDVFYNKNDSGEQELASKLQTLTDDIRNLHINAIQAKVKEDTIEVKLKALQGVSNEEVGLSNSDNRPILCLNDSKKIKIPPIPAYSVPLHEY